jgi:hypothetical protein
MGYLNYRGTEVVRIIPSSSSMKRRWTLAAPGPSGSSPGGVSGQQRRSGKVVVGRGRAAVVSWAASSPPYLTCRGSSWTHGHMRPWRFPGSMTMAMATGYDRKKNWWYGELYLHEEHYEVDREREGRQQRRPPSSLQHEVRGDGELISSRGRQKCCLPSLGECDRWTGMEWGCGRWRCIPFWVLYWSRHARSRVDVEPAIGRFWWWFELSLVGGHGESDTSWKILERWFWFGSGKCSTVSMYCVVVGWLCHELRKSSDMVPSSNAWTEKG